MSKLANASEEELSIVKLRKMPIEQVEKLAATDDVEAMVEMAYRYRQAGDAPKTDIWIKKAQSVLIDNDYDGLAALYSAIGGAWLGDFDYLERSKIALSYLIRLADAGNLFAQETLFIDYLEGLNGAPKDIERFQYWAKRAQDAGSEFATKELKKFTRKTILQQKKLTNVSSIR